MPYKGLHNGDAKPPQSVPERTAVECPECGDAMHVVKSHERESGAFVSRHFRHNREDGLGGGGEGGRSCGESDEHIKLKSIAASKLEHIFEDNCWKCELEYTFEDTVTDADHRQADAVLLFDDLDEQLGQGVAIEVQYKNKDKDTRAVERDYIENNISTVWVTPDDFTNHNLRLNEADIRARAKTTVWPKHVPKPTEWWQPSHTPRKEAFTNDDFNAHARDVSVPATFPEPLVDTIRYRESDWSALFAEHPERHHRLQAAIPHADRGGRKTTFKKAWWLPHTPAEYWRKTDWNDRFPDESGESAETYIKEVAESGKSKLAFGAILPLKYLTLYTSADVGVAPDPPQTPHDDVQCHNCGHYDYAPSANMYCRNCGTLYDWEWNIKSGRISADMTPELVNL